MESNQAVSKMDLDPSESQDLDTSRKVCCRCQSRCEQCRHWVSPVIMSPVHVALSAASPASHPGR